MRHRPGGERQVSSWINRRLGGWLVELQKKATDCSFGIALVLRSRERQIERTRESNGEGG